jgi:hypothetical protein
VSVQRASDKAVFKTQLQVAPPVPRFASVWALVALNRLSSGAAVRREPCPAAAGAAPRVETAAGR